jgi:adenine deaminase
MSRLCAIAVALALCPLLAVPARAQSADIVLVNGRIVTVDGQSSIREAVAVREGRIAAVGTSAGIRALAGPRTQVIDLQGTSNSVLVPSQAAGVKIGASMQT